MEKIRIFENRHPLIFAISSLEQIRRGKGAKTEGERQLFPLSKEALRLLEEIKHEFVARYGEVPVVAPSRSNTKREHLRPKRYLFQWDALATDYPQTINNADAQILLRFMLARSC